MLMLPRDELLKALVCLVIPLFFSGITHAQEYPEITLNKLVPEERQQEMGLHELSSEQRESFRLFVIETFLQGLEAGRKTKARDRVIESRISGNFQGWRGNTIVELANGRIWKQLGYFYSYGYSFIPKVLICQTDEVSKMWVEGVDEFIDVVQLK